MKSFVLQRVKWTEVDTQFESEIQTYKKMFKLISFENKNILTEEFSKARTLPFLLEKLEERWNEFKEELEKNREFIIKNSKTIQALFHTL